MGDRVQTGFATYLFESDVEWPNQLPLFSGLDFVKFVRQFPLDQSIAIFCRQSHSLGYRV